MYLLFFLFNGYDMPELERYLYKMKVDFNNKEDLFLGVRDYKHEYSLQKMLDVTVFDRKSHVDKLIRGKI